MVCVRIANLVVGGEEGKLDASPTPVCPDDAAQRVRSPGEVSLSHVWYLESLTSFTELEYFPRQPQIIPLWRA